MIMIKLKSSSPGVTSRPHACAKRGAGVSPVGLIILVGLTLFMPSACAAQVCRSHVTPKQKRDAETIKRVEHDWAKAVMTGDVEYVRCLLTDDYQSVGWKGVVRNKDWVLSLTKGNAGKQGEPPNNDATVAFHGDAVVRYADVAFADKDGSKLTVRFADFFVWDGGRWRAYYTQDTKLDAGPHIQSTAAREERPDVPTGYGHMGRMRVAAGTLLTTRRVLARSYARGGSEASVKRDHVVTGLPV